MAINSFSTLKTAVQNWIDRTDVADRVDEFISLGEARIYQDLRIRAMEVRTSDTNTGNLMTLPSDFLALKRAWLVTDPIRELTFAKTSFANQQYPQATATAKPVYITINASNLTLYPYPDTTYTIGYTYYSKLTALSLTNETNWFTTNAPNLLLFAALTEAAGYLFNDPRLPMWEERYQRAKQMIQKQENRLLRGSLRSEAN